MSAIPAASVSLKTMADGTLRMTFDIEPAHAKDAFSLFAAPGTPVAIAALQVGYAAAKEPEQKEPLGPLAKWLVIRCGEPEFWRWLEAEVTDGFPVVNEKDAGKAVKQLLGVESRREADENEQAENRCHKWIREPYQKWLVRRQG